MKEITDILSAYTLAVSKNKIFALATVVLVEGSSYRRPGARMLGTEDGELTGGKVRSGKKVYPLKKASKKGELVGEDEMTYGDLAKKYAQHTFGAHFVEVAVNAYTYEIRVRRMVAVCQSGRILNPKSARSQVIRAMSMGVGAALTEEMVCFHFRFINR